MTKRDKTTASGTAETGRLCEIELQSAVDFYLTRNHSLALGYSLYMLWTASFIVFVAISIPNVALLGINLS